MFEVLIVDDDPIIRRAIVQIINSSFESQCRTKTASNGLEAVEKVCNNKIDIIFSDIKMPFCDGIEMMQKLEELGYRKEIVIISGFDDYAFVRQAMKLGAVDYILKPIDVAEVKDILRKSILRLESLGELQEKHENKATGRAFLEQQPDIKLLLQNNAGHSSYLKGFEEKGYSCLWSVFKQHRQEIKDILFRVYPKEAIEVLQGEAESLWAVVLIAPEATIKKGLKEYIRCLKEEKITFGTTSTPVLLTKASLGWKEAVENWEHNFYNLPATTSFEDSYPFLALQKQLVDTLCENHFADFSEKLRLLLEYLCYQKPLIAQTKQITINIMYLLMSTKNEFIHVIGKYKFSDMDIFQEIQEAETISQLEEKVLSVVAVYLQEVFSDTPLEKGEEDNIVQKMQAVIRAEYMTDITLFSIAEQLSMNPSYLSTLFKQKTGITYSQYLRTVRIKEAEELIKHTNLKFYTIAERIGYNDNAHFYRAFKQETGYTPSQYKNKRK